MKNKIRHGTDPLPTKSKIVPIADTNGGKVLDTCLFVSTGTTGNTVTNVTTVITVTVVTNITTV